MIAKETIETHKTLQELQKQLNRLNSATQQIEEVKEISVNVTQNMRELQKKYQNHLDFLKDDNQQSNEKLNKTLQKQLEEITKAHLKLIDNTDSRIANVNSVFQDNISKSEIIQKEQHESIVEAHLQIIANLKTEIEEINSVFQSNIIRSEKLQIEQRESFNESHTQLIANADMKMAEFCAAFESNIKKSEVIQFEQHEKITEHLKSYDSFIKVVETLTATIEKVDFPNRLDKLDNTVSAINLGIQNTQTALVNMESAIRKNSDKQFEIIQSQFQAMEKANQMMKISIWVIGFVSIILLLGLFYKLL
ncbi:coiled-coil domain-containing protein [Aequorivita sinensis]|uniref:hypothetical protein n=1 Tax=Aequorivita sinensis TaxID=1382458 RepID=UPI002301B310|nr:hypothetical protein [Aequorivita sinensis]